MRKITTAAALVGVCSCSFRPVRLPDGECTPRPGVTGLRVAPGQISELWLTDEGVSRRVAIEDAACRPLDDVEIVEAPDWLVVTMLHDPGALTGHLGVDIDASALAVDEIVTGEVQLGRAGTVEGGLQLRVRRVVLTERTVGWTSGDCPAGCDHSGPDGLQGALAAITGERTVVTVYAGSAPPAIFDGPLRLPAATWLRTAPGVAPHDVIVTCTGFYDAAIQACGDDGRVSGIGVAVGASCSSTLSTRSSGMCPGGWVSDVGHLFERIDSFAARPEANGVNGIEAPFRFQRRVTLRNSSFAGYIQLDFNLRNARDITIVNNTIAAFQEPRRFIDLGQSVGVTFANNVILSLALPMDGVFSVEDPTSGLVIVGNQIEQARTLFHSVASSGGDVHVESNGVGVGHRVEVESPLAPRFLADTRQHAVERYRAGGTSLDGLSLDDVDDVVPGALQRRSTLAGERRAVVHLGGAEGCGRESCDLTSDLRNEVQQAIWSTWPGGLVRIHPSATPYAGDAVISWPVKVQGAAAPSDIVLESRVEDPLFEWAQTFALNDSVLALLWSAGGTTIEDLTVRDAAAATPAHRVYMEMLTSPYEPGYEPGWNRLSRLHLHGEGAGWAAIEMGPRVEIQDVLITGDFTTCLAWENQRDGPAREDSQALIANLTCRLANIDRVEAGMQVAMARSVHAINLVVELPRGSFIQDTGIPLPAGSLTVDFATVKGALDVALGFDPADHSIAVDEVAEPLFVSDSDSHLLSGAAPIDGGIDPTSIGLPPGVSLDGVSRTGHKPDRGAYEQGI